MRRFALLAGTLAVGLGACSPAGVEHAADLGGARLAPIGPGGLFEKAVLGKAAEGANIERMVAFYVVEGVVLSEDLQTLAELAGDGELLTRPLRNSGVLVLVRFNDEDDATAFRASANGNGLAAPDADEEESRRAFMEALRNTLYGPKPAAPPADVPSLLRQLSPHYPLCQRR